MEPAPPPSDSPRPSLEGREFEVQESRDEEMHDDATPVGTANDTHFVFKEMLSDDEAPVPTYDQLERFGLFDVTICTESLAQYRAKYPLPEDSKRRVQQAQAEEDEDENVPPRPSPQHRHSIAIAPSSRILPANYSPPLASPGLATASARLSPFALVRRTSRKERPSHPRTKSTNDVTKEAAVPPLLTPEDQVVKSDRRSSILSIASLATEDLPLASRASLDRDTTIKDKRASTSGGPRKLRRNPANRPALPVIRTDDDFLLRPSSQFRSRSPSPARSPQPSTSPINSRKQGWRSSLSNLVSPVSSPTSFEMPHEPPIPHPATRQPRSPSPIGSFPSNIRREHVLPPVDTRPRKDSLSDSYLGDSERHHQTQQSSSSSSKRDRSRSHSNAASIPSPSSPVSTGNLWARALKLGRRGGGGNGSRASSVASSSASTTSWDFIEGEPSERGTFEVIRNPQQKTATHPSRPMARRTSSEGAGSGPSAVSLEQNQLGRSRSTAEGQIVEASTSSPNLSKITEYPESLESRFQQYPGGGASPYFNDHQHYSKGPSPKGSIDSFTRSSQGFHTPPITANSSKTILAGPLDGTPTASSSAAGVQPLTPGTVQPRRIRSRSALSSSKIDPPLDESSLTSLPPSPPTFDDTYSTRTRSDSNASTTYRSTRSSSRDSIFSGDETPASSSLDEEGDLTGATSNTEGEEEEGIVDMVKTNLVIDDQSPRGLAA